MRIGEQVQISRETQQLFADVLNKYNWSADRRGEVHVNCPKCGREPKQNQVHFSFSVKGGKCFVCGWAAPLEEVAVQLGAIPPHLLKTVQQDYSGSKGPKKPAAWTRDPEAYLADYLKAPDRLDRWQQYKPDISLESITRWELGVGVLPASRCKHRRLIVPARVNGKVVAIRGRLFKQNGCDCEARKAKGLKPVCMEGCDCAKWLTAGSSETVLYNAGMVVPGETRVIIICENMLDVILGMQYGMGGDYRSLEFSPHDDFYAEPPLLESNVAVVPVCSTGGAASWKDEWTAWLRSLQLDCVTVWYDNDYPGGLPNRRMRPKMVAEWRQKNPHIAEPPLANGERLVERLSRAHLPVLPYEWPDFATPHMDMGDLFHQMAVLDRLEDEAAAREQETAWIA